MQFVTFHTVDEFEGWEAAPAAVKAIVAEYRPHRVLEVGSGANPTLDPGFVAAHGLEYTANDISKDELAKASAVYHRLALDISDGPIPASLQGQFDFIFSRMTNEHVRDGQQYHRNIHFMLARGGIAAHWFSTLYALPFLVNKLSPEWLSDWLLRCFAPRDTEMHDKFKAHYSWSRGPSPSMIRRIEDIGFDVLEFRGYYGHGYYAKRLPLLYRLERLKAHWLVKHPFPLLTSYARLILRKRDEPTQPGPEQEAVAYKG
jgi:hypothetical protein